MIFRCPHCGVLGGKLHYDAETSGWETGTCVVYDGGAIDDYDYTDRATTDTDNYTYKCAECEEELSSRVLRDTNNYVLDEDDIREELREHSSTWNTAVPPTPVQTEWNVNSKGVRL